MSITRAINENEQFNDRFKKSVVDFMTSLMSNYPDYDYSEFENKLRTLKLEKREVEGLSQYDPSTNTLAMDLIEQTKRGIDWEHTFFEDLLAIGTRKSDISLMTSKKPNSIEEFYRGIGKAMVSTAGVPDEGRNQTNILQYNLISMFSNIADPLTLVDAYMTNSFMGVMAEIRNNYGITQYEFRKLVEAIGNCADPTIEDNHAFSDGQMILLDMYQKKLFVQLSKGEIKPKEAKEDLDYLGTKVIRGKTQLLSTYEGNDFSKVRLVDKDTKAKLKSVRFQTETYCARYLEVNQQPQEEKGKGRVA